MTDSTSASNQKRPIPPGQIECQGCGAWVPMEYHAVGCPVKTVVSKWEGTAQPIESGTTNYFQGLRSGPRVIQVIESAATRGCGSRRCADQSPNHVHEVIRQVMQYHTLEGKLLAEHDPMGAGMAALGMENVHD